MSELNQHNASNEVVTNNVPTASEMQVEESANTEEKNEVSAVFQPPVITETPATTEPVVNDEEKIRLKTALDKATSERAKAMRETRELKEKLDALTKEADEATKAVYAENARLKLEKQTADLTHSLANNLKAPPEITQKLVTSIVNDIGVVDVVGFEESQIQFGRYIYKNAFDEGYKQGALDYKSGAKPTGFGNENVSFDPFAEKIAKYKKR